MEKVKNLYVLISVTIVCSSMLMINAPIAIAESEILRSQNLNDPLVYVIVNSTLYSGLRTNLEVYASDLEKIGLSTTILSFNGSNHTDLKAILVNAYSKGLVGCLLVGQLPSAYYEDLKVDNETYPCDLYLMDLDGNWTDADNNGRYDNHTGSRQPEIWLGRLVVSAVIGDEVSILRRYFDKNHDYRTGNLSLPDRALLYVDDPWDKLVNNLDTAVALAYDNRTIVSNKTITEPNDYLNRLAQNWSLVNLMVHGSGSTHSFETNDKYAGSVSSVDIRKTDPHVFFYNLFSCRSCNYCLPDYIAGSYVFGSNYSLAAVGPTDSGSMWILDSFYGNFSQNSLGFSFLQWMKERITAEDAGSWYDYSWFYGLTIIGDPTLSKRSDIERPETNFDLNGDGCVDITDVTMVAYAFGSNKGKQGYNPNYDFNRDRIIDIYDLLTEAQHFGEKYS